MEKSNYYNYIIELIKKRRSTRSFTGKKVERQDLLKIIEAGVYAPTGGNSQNVKFLIIDNPNDLKDIGSKRHVWPYPNYEKMKKKYPSGVIGNSNCAVFIFTDTQKNNYNDETNQGEYFIWKNLEKENASACIQNMLLAATALGIGNCWISINQEMNYTRTMSGKSFFDVFSKYGVLPHLIPQGCVILGYPRQGLDMGFPRGEKKHGPFLKPVERSKIDDYIIKKNEYDKTFFSSKFNIRKKIIDKLIKFTLGLLKFLDKLMIKINR